MSFVAKFLRYIIGTVIVLFLIELLGIQAVPAEAQDSNEFFEYTVTGFLDKPGVYVDEPFTANLVGRGMCKQDLPMSISTGLITGNIFARHSVTRAEVVLYPGYSWAINNIPIKKGQTFTIGSQISLEFPNESKTGRYDIQIEITNARFRVMGLWINGMSYMSADPIQISSIEVYTTEARGSVTPMATSSTSTLNTLTTLSSSIMPTSSPTTETDNSSIQKAKAGRLFPWIVLGSCLVALVLGGMIYIVYGKIRRRID